MKKIVILIFFLSSFLSLHAQKELWGTNVGEEYIEPNPAYKGNITKTDINGNNPEIVYEFDGIHGMFPKGRLFLASNGKLYGTAKSGGTSFYINPTISLTAGVLYEYDLILNKYRVVKYFDYNPILPSEFEIAVNPQIGVLEPISNQLYGATNNRIYKYDINTEITTFYNQLPPLAQGNFFGYELMKASDGNLYGATPYLACPGTNFNQYFNGCIVKFNMITNNLSVVHPINCDRVSEGFFPYSQLIETSPGKLIGVTKAGGFLPVVIYGDGILFEYNFITNVFTKKIEFNKEITGEIPLSLINGGNGKIYGLCESAGAVQTCNPTWQDGSVPPYRFGTLFEYTPTTNALEIKQYFNYCGNFVKYPKSIIKTSLGHIIGSSYNFGYFKFDTVTNQTTSISEPLAPTNSTSNGNFIEICRKPSYQEFLPNTYAPEQGTAFSYNIQNTNATTYVWKKGTTILPAQITGILNLPSVTTNDTGMYTCTMTNECGITVTMPLNINVTNLATETIDNYKEFITLHPNPTKGIINLKFPENRGMKALSYKVTNLLGQVVLENNIAKNNTATSIIIDTASFANGIYQVTLATDKGNWNGKFVKE